VGVSPAGNIVVWASTRQGPWPCIGLIPQDTEGQTGIEVQAAILEWGGLSEGVAPDPQRPTCFLSLVRRFLVSSTMLLRCWACSRRAAFSSADMRLNSATSSVERIWEDSSRMRFCRGESGNGTSNKWDERWEISACKSAIQRTPDVSRSCLVWFGQAELFRAEKAGFQGVSHDICP
jgi:hypothetical protein